MTATAVTISRDTAGVGLGAVVRAEWTKFRTVRSFFCTLAGSAVATVALGAVIVLGHLHEYERMNAQARPSIDPVAESMIGLWFGLVGFSICGVLAATSEYSSGTIRATVAAVPRRLAILVAKATVVGVAAAIIAAVTSFASFFATQPILARHSLDASLGEPGVLRAVLGGAAMITGAALVGLGLGALVRHSAGAFAAVTVLFFVAPMIVELQPESWATVTKFLPHTAGSSMFTVRPDAELLSPGGGLAVFTAWILVLLALAGRAFTRRDV